MTMSYATERLSVRLLNSAGIAALLLSGICISTAASAQTAGSSDQSETVVVTGSRINATPGFESPTPVTEISPLQLAVKDEPSVVNLMFDIPELTPNQQDSDAVDVGISTFNLRDLGASRTLTLIDGLRTEFTSVNGGFDVNSLPADLIQHVDIVTGGASAAYGSDAVAGVVNVTLNTTFTGLKANIGWGESAYGDNGTETASGAWGGEFLGGRAHVVLAADYFNQAGVLSQGSRLWGRSLAAVIANPACKTLAAAQSTGCSELLRVTGADSSDMSDGGVILGAISGGAINPATGAVTGGTKSSVLNDVQFGPGGVAQPFTLGADAGGTYMIGGSGSLASQSMGLQPQVDRVNFLQHSSYDITPDLSIWTQLLYSKSDSYIPIVPNFNNGNITITNQNPFIPASIQAVMAANNITSLTMGRSNIDLAPVDDGRDLENGRNEDYDSAVGAKGQLGVFGTHWNWDVNAQYDSHLDETWIGQNQISQNWLNSIDAVANPAVGGVSGVAIGQAVCRSTLTNPTNGCVPVNLFGTNTVTSAVTNYTMGTSWVHANLDMFDVSANLHGTPFSTWAGPESIAFGGEWRRQTTDSVSDPISTMTGFRNGNQTPYKGAYSVGEGYLELDTPIAKNLPFAEAADIDAAVRMTDYSTSGGVTTWKVGLNYQPTDDIRLRGTRSHDIRAPDLTELFQSGTLRNGGVITNPITGVQAVANGLTTGNPNLVPEIGDTITGGIVYSPSWLAGFNVSADYWHIKMTQVITQFSAQQEVNNCLSNNEPQFCQDISYNSLGVISQVASTYFNAAILETDGWDFEAAYQFDVGDVINSWNGTMMIHGAATWLDTYISTGSAGIAVDEAGCLGSCSLPRLRMNWNEIYLNDPWQISIEENWISGGTFSYLYNPKNVGASNAAAIGAESINNNQVDGRFYVNLSVAYQLNNVWQVYGRVDNLFNVNPPLLPDGLAFQHISNTGLYDHIGTQFLVGVKLAM